MKKIIKQTAFFRVKKQVGDLQWNDGVRMDGKHQENGWTSGSMYAVTNIIDYME